MGKAQKVISILLAIARGILGLPQRVDETTDRSNEPCHYHHHAHDVLEDSQSSDVDAEVVEEHLSRKHCGIHCHGGCGGGVMSDKSLKSPGTDSGG